MHSNTRSQGVDPAGAFSPARHVYRPSLARRALGWALLFTGLVAGTFLFVGWGK